MVTNSFNAHNINQVHWYFVAEAGLFMTQFSVTLVTLGAVRHTGMKTSYKNTDPDRPT
jgi:hypothetical protein